MFHAYHILFVCSYLQVKNILTVLWEKQSSGQHLKKKFHILMLKYEMVKTF